MSLARTRPPRLRPRRLPLSLCQAADWIPPRGWPRLLLVALTNGKHGPSRQPMRSRRAERGEAAAAGGRVRWSAVPAGQCEASRPAGGGAEGRGRLTASSACGGGPGQRGQVAAPLHRSAGAAGLPEPGSPCRCRGCGQGSPPPPGFVAPG